MRLKHVRFILPIAMSEVQTQKKAGPKPRFF